jgi:hypothetical protein
MIILILAMFCFISREQLKRAVIAILINHEHIFVPPARLKEESWLSGTRKKFQFYWDVAELRISRDKRLKKFDPTIKPIIKEINRKQAAGEAMQYSMHMYREIRWRLNFTPDTAATRKRIDDLFKSISQPELQKLASVQQASDGSWGAGISIWFLKLYYSVDKLQDSNLQLKFPLLFLDQINSPEKLIASLDSDLYNNFTKTAIFNREELDETFSAVARLLNKSQKVYAFHSGLDSALRDYVNNWQNPESGCWGQWMVDRHGEIWKMDDVGITFHVVSDLHGQVSHTDLIAKRLLELDHIDFPAGIRFNGDYNNHLNWDAVKIFRYAWPFLDEAIRRKVRLEISHMLNWCLTESYQPDGSFKISDLDDTMGDAYRYGVAFLSETGYFNTKNCFWTDQNFTEAKEVRDHIKSKLLSIGLNESGLKEAYEILNGKDF